MRPDYWIVFKSSPLFHQKLCRKGFGHCFVLAKDDYNWLLINPGVDRFETLILDVGPTKDIPKTLAGQPGFSVVKVEIEPAHRKHFHLLPLINLPFINCVSMVKYIIGAPLKGFTPFGLWKHLWRLAGKSKLPVAIRKVTVII